MKTDIRHYALRALETAKEDLRRDKYLLPVAFILTKEDVFDYNLEFENAEQKASVYRELVEVAKQKHARAIITINDATVRNVADTTHERTGTGLPNENGIQECIFVTVSGPGIQTWSISLPNIRTAGEIVFGNQNETSDDILNLLPGWPRNHTPAS